MKTTRLFAIVFLLLCIGATTPIMAQAKGGRKREHRNQRGGGGRSLFKRNKSAGHADAFARGGRKKGFFAKTFGGHKKTSSWTYRKTNPGARQNREQAGLFSRDRTRGKRYREGILAKQNKQRSRSRGSDFSKRRR